MTRFNISLTEGVDLVLYALENAIGREIFVPKIPSYQITDVAKAIAPDCEIENIGIRPGEKIHEEMVTSSDSFYTLDTGKHYIILPPLTDEKFKEYMKNYNAKPVEKGFTYNSGTNEKWLTVDELRDEIKKHVDPNFQPR